MGTLPERVLVCYIRPSKLTRMISYLQVIVASSAESPVVESSLLFIFTILHAKHAWVIQATIAWVADIIHTSNAASPRPILLAAVD